MMAVYYCGSHQVADLLTYSLDYEANSQRLMSRLAELDRPVFLDSGPVRGEARRFDILAAEPRAWLQVAAGKCSCSDADIDINQLDIFNKIRLLRDKHLSKSDHPLPTNPAYPFQGGLLGYLGYPQLQGRAQFKFEDVYVGVYPWAVIVDHASARTTLVLQPSCNETLALRLVGLLSTNNSHSANTDAQFRLTSNFQRQLTRTEYDNAFIAIKGFIRAGDCYQVNLTQRVTATFDGDPCAAYLRLRAASPAPFSAFIAWPEGAILSVSPERFVKLTGRQVLTQPIKGTRRRDSDPIVDADLARELQSSEKDQAENLMIVDLLRNDLGRVCKTGSIKANQLFTLHSFSNVHHLISSIEAQLASNRDGLDLLEACFPGGSITGAPKLRAMEIIQELEQSPRRVYCGAAFYLSADGNMDSSITIRTLLWEAGALHCWAGGGIVDDSESDAEYAECFDKINSIISSLAR